MMDHSTDNTRVVGVIVAHPDDEILWAGGTLLMHPQWRCHILILCRASDADRSARFSRVLHALGASGQMGNLDDGPELHPLPDTLVQQAILDSTDGMAFDQLFTHGPSGEYTYHLRHVEVSRAVRDLWSAGALQSRQLCLFAYEDGQRAYLPRPRKDARVMTALPPEIWEKKHRLITEEYGFSTLSWEAQTTPVVEAFDCFISPQEMRDWLRAKEERQ